MTAAFINTVKERCRVCYTCVRECPAKAIRILEGQAEIGGQVGVGLRLGDEQNEVMDKIMALPKIEDDWDEQYVMDQLLGLASEKFGDEQ